MQRKFKTRPFLHKISADITFNPRIAVLNVLNRGYQGCVMCSLELTRYSLTTSYYGVLLQIMPYLRAFIFQLPIISRRELKATTHMEALSGGTQIRADSLCTHGAEHTTIYSIAIQTRAISCSMSLPNNRPAILL